MAADELNTPLGQRRKASKLAFLSRYRIPLSAGQLLAIVAGLFLAVFFGFALFGNNPLGGEPGVKIAIDPSLLPKPAAAPVPSPAGAAQHGAAAPPANPPAIVHGQPPVAAPGQPASGTSAPVAGAGEKTITIIDGSSGQRRDVVVPAPGGAGEKAAPGQQSLNEGGLFESSRYGEIPIISPAGIRPMQAYAQPSGVTPTALASQPVVALVVTGLGIGASRTEQAIGALPQGVTLGFVPYGGELAALVAKARQDGHEVLLQLPMEPFDYPDNDPGPQTLLTTANAEQNLDRLMWHLSRIKGYVGVTNFMGGRFMASEDGMKTVMGDLKKRGLLFLDDGSNLRSAAATLAKGDQVPFLKADVVIDATTGAGDIDKMLMRLEGLARQKGSAIGVASALPVSIARIDAWAKSLASKGVLLLPLTSVMRKTSSS